MKRSESRGRPRGKNQKRRAVAGSTWIARRVGMYVASAAATTRTTDAVTYVAGSSGTTPNSTARQRARDECSGDQSTGDTSQDEPGALTKQQHQQLGALNAERHANTDLA